MSQHTSLLIEIKILLPVIFSRVYFVVHVLKLVSTLLKFQLFIILHEVTE